MLRRGQLAQLSDHGRLARRGVDLERPLGADDARQRGVQQGGDAGLADDLQHGGDVVLAGADVARDELGLERGGGIGGHERLLTRAAPWRDAEAGCLPTCHQRLAPECLPVRSWRLRGSGEVCPFGAPVATPGATGSWSWRWCAGTLPHGVDQPGQPNIRGWRGPPLSTSGGTSCPRRYGAASALVRAGVRDMASERARRRAAADVSRSGGPDGGCAARHRGARPAPRPRDARWAAAPARPRPRARRVRPRCRTRPGHLAPGR